MKAVSRNCSCTFLENFSEQIYIFLNIKRINYKESEPAKCVPGGKSKSPATHFWYQEWCSLFSLIGLRRAACLIGQYGSGEYSAEAVDVQAWRIADVVVDVGLIRFTLCQA